MTSNKEMYRIHSIINATKKMKQHGVRVSDEGKGW